MASFVASLWRILNRCTSNRMVRTKGADTNAPGITPERGFRVGMSAAERGLESSLRMRSGQMYLRPEAM
ncbi:hypothetical protein P3T37_000745 [Kitasatospora sp. MAA4]|nr:hypothetical protein [Kitasatospora sp. MAA4]